MIRCKLHDHEMLSKFFDDMNTCGEALSVFCMLGCVYNFPPAFCWEDLDRHLLAKIRMDVKKSEKDKKSQKIVWQTFKNISNQYLSWDNKSTINQPKMRDENFHSLSVRKEFRSRFARREASLIAYLRAYLHTKNSLQSLRSFTIDDEINKTSRNEWLKTMNIMPIRIQLGVQSEDPCRLFRMQPHLNQSHITFLRSSFQDHMRSSRPDRRRPTTGRSRGCGRRLRRGRPGRG